MNLTLYLDMRSLVIGFCIGVLLVIVCLILLDRQDVQ